MIHGGRIFTCHRCGRRFDAEVFEGGGDSGFECPVCSNSGSVYPSRFGLGGHGSPSEGTMVSPVENARLKSELGRLRRRNKKLRADKQRLLSRMWGEQARQAALEKEIEVERLRAEELRLRYELLVVERALDVAKCELGEAKEAEFRRKPM